ncbi:MAG: EAL domain-containing protein [Mycobacteriaceae bacterium]
MAGARPVASHRRGGALLFVDLDEFKQINDSLSHAAGDEVLTEVGRRLGSVTRAGDTVARLGGDEFAVLLDDAGPDSVIEDTAERILDAVSAPIQITDGLVHVTASIGSASLPGAQGSTESGTTTAGLLHRADVALHRAKDAGRNRHVQFHPEHLEHARRRRDREDALREALGAQEITAVFQPVIDVADGRVVAAEALARWRGADGSSVPPQEFIEAAEASGLITRLGDSMLRQSCAAALAWDEPLRVAVNVSALELHRSDYAETVLRILDETGLPAQRLELEVTETQWVNDAVVSSEALSTLAGAGVSVVLDDFGTGYSSFRHLADMPVSGVKIDRSFIGSVTTDERCASVVRAILCMAYELGLRSIAEGVETQEQLDFLVENGVTHAQGYLIGRPSTHPPRSRLAER